MTTLRRPRHAVLLVSGGYRSGTGYYHRVVRDRAAIESLGLACSVVSTAAVWTWLRLGKPRRFFDTLATLRSATLLVVQNYGALTAYRALAPFISNPDRRLVFVVHGSLAELAEFAWGQVKGPVYKRAEQVIARSADRIFCVSEVMADDFRLSYPNAAARIRSSPNNPGPEFVTAVSEARQVDQALLRASLALPKDAAILLYAGNLQVWQRIDRLVQLTKELVAMSTDFHVVCLTSRSDDMARLFGGTGMTPSRVTIRSVPHEMIPGYLVAADWLYLLRDRSEINRVACPTKAVEYLHSGRPLIVSTDLGDISDTVAKCDRGLVVDDQTHPRDLALILLRAMHQRRHGETNSSVLELPLQFHPDHNRRLFEEVICE